MKQIRILLMSLLLVCMFTMPVMGASTPSASMPDTINGLSADEWLVQSSVNLQKYNMYQSIADITTAMTVDGLPDETVPTEMNLHSTQNIFVQMQPLILYSRQKMDMPSMPGVPAGISQISTETMIKDNTMYTNMMGSGWMTLPMPFANFEQEMAKYNSQDPLQMLAQLRQFGIHCAFSQQTVINGKEYVVIDVTADPDQMMQQYKTLMSELVPNLAGQDAIDFNQFMSTMKIDLFCRMYIDKQSMLPDKGDIDMTFGMSIPNPENPAQVANMNMKINGTASYFGWGQPFALPDVSKAVPLSNATSTQISL